MIITYPSHGRGFSSKVGNLSNEIKQNPTQEKIDNCFINEIKLLYQLRYIKNYLNRGGKINDKLKRLFEKNDLYIKLRGDIYQMMRN